MPGWAAGFVRGVYIIFLLVPFVVAIPVSFSELAVFPPNAFTLKWYGVFFSSRQFNQGWQISLTLALIVACASTFVGALAAIAVMRYRIPGRRFIESLILSPLIVPEVATGIGLIFYFAYTGLLEGWTRLVIAHVIVTTPYVVRVMTATLYAFDRSLEEAAMNLGATEIQVFRTVTLPIVRTGLVAGFIFAFMASFENLTITAFVAQPGFGTLPVVLFGYVRDEFNPIVAVVTVVMIVGTSLVMLLADRLVGIDRLLRLRQAG